MGHIRCLPFALMILNCFGQVLLQNEQIQTEINDSYTDLENLKSSLVKSIMMQTALESDFSLKRKTFPISFYKFSQKPERKMYQNTDLENHESSLVESELLKILLKSKLNPEKYTVPVNFKKLSQKQTKRTLLENLETPLMVSDLLKTLLESNLNLERNRSPVNIKKTSQKPVKNMSKNTDLNLEPSLLESDLLKTLLKSNLYSKRNIVPVGFKNISQKPVKAMSKKALGVFRHGRPSLFFKSGFTSNTGSYSGRSGFGRSRFVLDRPRPLRWG